MRRRRVRFPASADGFRREDAVPATLHFPASHCDTMLRMCLRSGGSRYTNMYWSDAGWNCSLPVVLVMIAQRSLDPGTFVGTVCHTYPL